MPLTALAPAGQNMVLDVLRACTRVMKTLTTGANLFFWTKHRQGLADVFLLLVKTITRLSGGVGIMDAMRQVTTGGKFDEDGYYRLYRAMGQGIFASSSVT